MSNLQPNCCLKFDFQKVDQHAGGKWLIHDTKRRVMCTYYAYVTIRRTLGGTCFESHLFLNKVLGQRFSAENKQEAAELYSQHLPMHSPGIIWKIKSKSNFPVSFSLISTEMNLVGTHEKINGHRELTVSSRWPRWSLLRGPMITAQSWLEYRRLGHSSVTARSQLSHGHVTTQLQWGHSSITAR